MTVSGCSWFHHRSDEPAVAARASAPELPDSAEALPADEMTATEAATSGAGASASASSGPTTVDAGMLAPNAPKSYVVKRGDTLWGIASTFLRDPWLWPEVWYINPQVANPHLIYPGDTLALAFGKDGRPIIRLEQGGAARLDPRLRSSPLDGAVPTIPYSAISAFLSRPSVLTDEQVHDSPHVVAFRDEHVVAGTGHTVYIADLKAEPNSRYSVVHVGEPLRDPDDNKVVGYQGIYTATALVSQPGQPTKALLIAAAAGAGIMGLVALMSRSSGGRALSAELLRNAAYDAQDNARRSARDLAREATERASAKADALMKQTRGAAQSAYDGLADTMQQWKDQAGPLVDRVRPQIDTVMTYAKDDPGKALLIAAAAGAALMGLMSSLTRRES